eukprot:GFUD01139630.1.p1 GENE.GFUD01139630.1~~GFUD01139630.1.p1  ORF type:complete len:182 (-),score=50.81 GFUD01139630.1:19-540(-)
MESLVLHNWQVREQERAHDREERRLREEKDREERERKENDLREERVKREEREERRLTHERNEKDRMNIFMLKLMGQGQESNKDKKEITITAPLPDSGSQPLPIKLNLSSLVALKKDLCDYLEEASVDGVVMELAVGESVILSDVDQIDVSHSSSFVVLKLVKSRKSYFKLVRI